LRVLVASVFVVCVAAILGWGQHSPALKATSAELLDMLRSDDPAQRADAYEHLRLDPSALRSATVKSALLDLLDRENSVHESAIRERTGISDKYGEGYTEYAYALGETVASFVNWNDPHQVCMAVRGFVPESVIADHARATIPCLLQKARSNLGLVRGRAVAVLVRALAKGRNDLDARTIERAEQTIRGALRDPDSDVRTDAVEALGHYGSEDMIPALKEVAETDPSPDGEYAIRKWAAEAIAAIQKRAGEN
jgi:HEAT repeats